MRSQHSGWGVRAQVIAQSEYSTPLKIEPFLQPKVMTGVEFGSPMIFLLKKHGQSARRSAVMFAICNISIIRSFGRIVEKRKVF